MGSYFNSFFTRVTEAVGVTNLTELSKILNVNRSAVTQARKKDSVPATWLLVLFKDYGLNPEWLENGTAPRLIKPPFGSDPGYHHVPKVQARLCAGDGSFEVAEDIEGYYAFKKSWLQRRGVAHRMVLMNVFGNSMTPEIKDGDAVLIDQSQTDIIAGAIFAVGVDETIMVKRVEKHPGKLVLLSDNREYAPIFLTPAEIDSIRIIGKVLWICRELR